LPPTVNSATLGRGEEEGSPMEPMTQALLGAATAECVAGRALRGRALGWGAVIGMSPDLDVLLGPLHGGYGEWLYHRGTTHSLWFGFVVGPVLGWALWRWRDGGRTETLPGWIRLAIIALVTHPILDGFTPYGTQFFAPFSRERFAWNGVAIVDPFYSVLLGAGVLGAAIRSFDAKRRRRWLIAGLSLSTLYLAVGLAVNRGVEQELRNVLEREEGPIDRVRAYPTIFQPWLRSFVVRAPDAIYVGLHAWQQHACPVWRRYPRKETTPAARVVLETWEGGVLAWFADGDFITLIHTEPGGIRSVRLEDARYSWASETGRGIWGIEARVHPEGGLLGRPVRFARAEISPKDAERVAGRLLGRLPSGPEWRRPADCDPNG
jgi:inner membrane protein